MPCHEPKKHCLPQTQVMCTRAGHPGVPHYPAGENTMQHRSSTCPSPTITCQPNPGGEVAEHPASTQVRKERHYSGGMPKARLINNDEGPLVGSGAALHSMCVLCSLEGTYGTRPVCPPVAGQCKPRRTVFLEGLPRHALCGAPLYLPGPRPAACSTLPP